MANLCSYDLYAKGTKEGLLKLRRMLEQEEKPYVINAKYCSELVAGRIRKNEDGSYSQKFSSATRWSVAGAMLDERRNSDEYCTLQRAAELTGTELELYSEEPGCCFGEHIRISPDGRGTIEERPFYLFFKDSITAETGPDPDEKQLTEYLAKHMANAGADEPEKLLKQLNMKAIMAHLDYEGYIAIGGFEDNDSNPFVLE